MQSSVYTSFMQKVGIHRVWGWVKWKPSTCGKKIEILLCAAVDAARHQLVLCVCWMWACVQKWGHYWNDLQKAVLKVFVWLVYIHWLGIEKSKIGTGNEHKTWADTVFCAAGCVCSEMSTRHGQTLCTVLQGVFAVKWAQDMGRHCVLCCRVCLQWNECKTWADTVYCAAGCVCSETACSSVIHNNNRRSNNLSTCAVYCELVIIYCDIGIRVLTKPFPPLRNFILFLSYLLFIVHV